MLRQIDLGQDRRDAFLALRERNESDSLKSFVAAQLQAEELGVPLSEALNDIASDMRRMADQNARRQAQRASPRVSLLVTTLIVPGSMILIVLSMYFAHARIPEGPASLADKPRRPSRRPRRRRRRRLAGERVSPDPQRPRGHPARHARLAGEEEHRGLVVAAILVAGDRIARAGAALGADRPDHRPPPVLPRGRAGARGADPVPHRRRQPVLLLHARHRAARRARLRLPGRRRCSR